MSVFDGILSQERGPCTDLISEMQALLFIVKTTMRSSNCQFGFLLCYTCTGIEGWGCALYCVTNFFAAGNEFCPQPQTSEHLAAIEIMKLKHIIILQNKIDLVKENVALEQYQQIIKFIQGTMTCSLSSMLCIYTHAWPVLVEEYLCILSLGGQRNYSG